MSKLTITVGIPASGKTTWALRESKRTGAVVVCRDDLRAMQGFSGVGSPEQENMITSLVNTLIASNLSAGNDVIVADTNINSKFRNKLVKLGAEYGADVAIKVFDVDLDEAIRRDARRDRVVGKDAITKMYKRFSREKVSDNFIPFSPFSPYSHTSDLPTAYIVDIDGTLAHNDGHRSFYDESKVIDDAPKQDVIDVINKLYHAGDKIIFVSGRTDKSRNDTVEWLRIYTDIDDPMLFMRKSGDMRPDYVVKNEIYDAELIPHYRIAGVFDDRDQVVRHLRSRGITVFQVAPGNF